MPGMIDNAALRLAEPIVPQIINRLRQAIIELRLEPGQPLSEKEIALLYGVSRQPCARPSSSSRRLGSCRFFPVAAPM